ncbi:MAG: GNAT family N-acetyltransferase [Oscillospiraceae bacterium]|nr:GNAT family N-acetyltransferase [Oscillospiraceae bacterium]
MHHIATQRIETARLILRPFIMADATAMYENWASDPAVTQYLTWPPHSSVEVTRMVLGDWIEKYRNPDWYNWAITLNDGKDTPIGNISAVACAETTGSVEIGYCLGRAWWGSGIMTEALRAVIGFFIGQVGVNRVEARHDTQNPASGKVMQKAGMTFEGILRQAAKNNRGVIDIGVHSILASEWNKG